MKRLISPPIQLLFWLGGLALMGLSAWSLWNLKLQVESKHTKAEDVSVQIPDATLLASPDPNRYPKMVQAPLFWESRKAVEPPKPEQKQVVAAPVDTALPEGRLIGIVDLGDKLFALFHNAAGGGVQLKVGEMWGAWKVSGIDPDKIILTLGDQRKELPLVGEFAAPKANPQAAQAKAPATKANGAKAPPQPTAAAPVPAPQGAAVAESAPTGLPFPNDTQKQPAPLSAQEALEARQRLMASRWGALTGEGGEAANGQGNAANGGR